MCKNLIREMKRKLSSCGLALVTMIMFTESIFGNFGEISTVKATEYRTMSSSSSSSGDTVYYYDTDEKMPKKATYDNEKFDLLNKVKKGDIIYEAKGGAGLTGHIAIVEGIFTNEDSEKKYIRIIEAIDKGVKRGILDDQRMKDKEATVLRIESDCFKFEVKDKKTKKTIVKNKKSKIIKAAVKFAKSQIGKDYALDLRNFDTGEDNEDWYCSKLVWAAYKNNKVNIAGKTKVPEPGITPREIYACKKLKKIVKYTEG